MLGRQEVRDEDFSTKLKAGIPKRSSTKEKEPAVQKGIAKKLVLLLTQNRGTREISPET